MSDKSMRGRVRPRVLLIMLLVLAAALAYGWYDFSRFSHAPLNVTTQGDSIDVGRGTSFRNIVGELHQRNLSTINIWYWRLLAEQMRVAGKLHAGEYALDLGITPRQLLANMAGPTSSVTTASTWTMQRSCRRSAPPPRRPRGASCRRPTPT
jgi:UPF0755 protein